LINAGIIPLVFENPVDYDAVDFFDDVEIPDILGAIEVGKATLVNTTKNTSIRLISVFSERQIEVLKVGGYLNYMKDHER
jgi:aconitate hydratase